jgi:hypothetical protein
LLFSYLEREKTLKNKELFRQQKIKWTVIAIVLVIFCASVERALPQDKKTDRLTPENQLLLQRFVSGELVKILQSLPCDHKSVAHLKAGEGVAQGIRVVGSCQTDIGAIARITGIEVEKDKIKVDINGGTNPKKSLRQKIGEHVEVGMSGGGGTVSPQIAPQERKEAPPNVANFEGRPATILVEFKEFVPDMTPDDFKQILSAFLDFPKNGHSAAVQWIDTRSPEVKQAIIGRYAIVGMDSEEVIAAIGKPVCGQPSCKIRERNEDGVEVETWMYGRIPFITFVEFIDHKVSRIVKPRSISDR